MADNTGIVSIHGKSYETVALRVQKLRAAHADWQIQTSIIHRDAECVVMKAVLADANGNVLGTGHAEEYRDSSQINRTSALENAETSAIGRALAAAGYGGTEFASADELKRAIVDKQPAKPNTALQTCKDEFDRMSEEEQAFLRNRALETIALIDEGRLVEAWKHCSDKLEREEQLALWSLFDSKQRTALNKGKDQSKEAA